MVRIGINGFGRIGRQVAKLIMENYPETLKVVAINDLSPVETNAHLFKYDSNFGSFGGEVRIEDGCLVINGNKIKTFAMM